MLDHLCSIEFIQNAFWIFVFSLALVPLLYLLVRGSFGILKSFGEQTNHESNEDAAYSGCGGCLILVIFLAGMGFVCQWLVDKFVKMPTPAGVEATWGDKNMRALGPIVVFQKEAPLLYNYYQELSAIHEKEKAYIETLEYERDQASTAPAKQAFEKQLRLSRTRLDELNALRTRIEDLAGKLHFARYMADLGLHIDEGDLQSEVTKATHAGSAMVKERKNSKN